MKRFDYIIAGGGCAGLSLAYHLVKQGLQGKTILIIEKEKKDQNDRTWCFWAHEPTFFDEIIFRQWDQIRFTSSRFDQIIPLQEYRYNMIRGIDFYAFTREVLRRAEGVSWLHEEVETYTDTTEGVNVKAGGKEYSGQFLFNSMFSQATLQPDPNRYHYMWQHFKGWEIETEQDCFDTSYATMFDFRTPQQGEMRFVYVLPFSSRSALVEFTLFTGNLLTDAEYDKALADYVKDVLGITSYRIKEIEKGKIPMTDHPFSRREGKHIYNIGTRGGVTKPSTGYTFLRIQQDCKKILQALQQGKLPEDKGPSLRYHTYDSMLLQVMHRKGELSEKIFTDLFRKNPIGRLFRFLDEETNPLEDLQVMASVPPFPFIEAFIKLKALQKV
jgi:lycopene beta-cyclase